MANCTLTTDVAIVGGGLAGLACAVALRGSGMRVAVFDAATHLGGRAGSCIDAVTSDAIDLGPHIFLSEYRNTLDLLAQLGTREQISWETERLIRLTAGEQVTDMHLHALPPPLHLAPSFARLRNLRWSDKLSNLRMVWLAMRLDEDAVRELDRISAAELLHLKGVKQAFIDWFWATACMTVMNVPLERCSAGALMRVFAQLIGRNNYRIGFAAVALAELFVPGAVRAIEAAGGRVETKTTVRQIIGDHEQAAGLTLDDGTQVKARHYIAAVPPRQLHQMLPEAWRRMHPFRELTAFEPSPYVSSYLWFDRKLSNDKFWTRIWNPRDLNSDFYDLANIRAGWRQRPSVIASNIIYSHRAQGLTDADIVQGTLKEIRDVIPAVSAAKLRHATVNRIDMAIPCPSPGTESKRPATITPIRGLLLAGDWTRTCLPACMESAVYSGRAAAEVIWRAQGHSRQLAMPVKQREGLARWLQPAAGD